MNSALKEDKVKHRSTLFIIALFLAVVGATAAQSIAERYGSREPRNTITDFKAPTKGPITPELAKKYFINQNEVISGGDLHLYENVTIEVGGRVPYTPNLGAFEAIDVNVGLYPIRGSYVHYSCRDLLTEYVGPAGLNARRYNHPKATGYAYKNTFGDWRVYLADRLAFESQNVTANAAPPK